MCIKRYITKYLFVIYGNFKKMGCLFWIPIFIICVFLPLVNLRDCISPNVYSKYFIDSRNMYLIPVGVVVWIFLTLKPYVSENGRELLYVYTKSKLAEVLIETVLYNIMVLIPFIILYARVLDDPILIYIKYLICSFMFASITYLVIFLFNSVNICIMFVFGVYIIELLSYLGNLSFPTFFNMSLSNYYNYFTGLVVMMIITVVSVIVGKHFNNYYISYE